MNVVKSERYTNVKTDEILDRRAKVWELRVNGGTVREIAAELGFSVGTIQNDLHAVREELDDLNSCRAETERAIGASRLDKVAKALLKTVDSIGYDADGNPDASALATTANAIARIEERRAKLLGLDRPYETIIHQTEASPEEARRLMAEKFGRTAKQDTEPQQEEHESP